jgi:uncharacterized protein YhaN
MSSYLKEVADKVVELEQRINDIEEMHEKFRRRVNRVLKQFERDFIGDGK